ncbi:ATP-dependent DNA helicase RecG [Acetivibrio clariflavus]|uniref:ATP-dependent DNA helicase RecG n=1 Tax=Acetivibrio clariflavus (strain DSM 19732 / NBRC 101661 / EBR45) TaxID=720554 RepID=G8LXT3_ACECE|nr:ATP-dependent DNA helicase RecG [Acetivibrio clariflavus]AEV68836.1 ATP-dependent DNA helicase RecG [Acetivibrio clariflavus DSM 19732]
MEEDIKELLKMDVQKVKGVGQARAKQLHKLGIYSVEDIITYYPRDYEDRSRLKKIGELVDGESCTFEGIIASKVTEHRFRKGLTMYKVLIKDETGAITATWFNQHYIGKVLKPGERYIFFGKISGKYRNLEVQNPVYEKLEDGIAKNVLKIVPVYPSTADLSQNTIRGVISNALDLVDGRLTEFLPEKILREYRLSEINYSVRQIHFPRSDEDFKNARYRLVFEELFILQLCLLSVKKAFENNNKGIEFSKVPEMEDFIKSLPFKLTDAQRKVFEEIERDMESSNVMNRLVQGDVGSGKTVVAAMALFKAVRNGYQGALMVPTAILAEQHYQLISSLMEPFGINTALLTGNQTKNQKNEILEGIRSGKIDILIGTHALIEDNVEFMKLGLVITDEQHRFGVRQRALLSKKGEAPDVIVMTATPIPRTLALILYGDLDISIIDQLPPGRKPVKTYAVDESMRERVNGFIRKEVSEGRQVYIVCPLVEESSEIEAKSAVQHAKDIAEKDFRDLKVGLLHGKMKSKEKEEVMKKFVEGEIDILVSTTVIEVGVNVPNASIMVVENAERFGLAQLHQLRGRVGRGKHQSYCILYSDGKTQVCRERMKIMQKTNDGFVISEKDLELRGPGEFFGTRQHGIPELKIANLYKDIDILKKAQEAALKLISEDRDLEKEENYGLKLKMMEILNEKLYNITMN